MVGNDVFSVRRQLRGAARGYKQRAALERLMRGEAVANPAYFVGDVPVKPRKSDLEAWENFRIRLVQRGFTLNARNGTPGLPWETLYTLRTIEPVHRGSESTNNEAAS